MATPLRSRSDRPALRGRLLLVLVGLGAAALAFYWRPLTGTAHVAAAYGARIGCSCRYVEGRPLGECRRDFEPGMSLVTLSEDAAARRVTARFALVVKQSAAYRDGWGCQLDRWAD